MGVVWGGRKRVGGGRKGVGWVGGKGVVGRGDVKCGVPSIGAYKTG